MNILVCIKQVMESGSEIKIDSSGSRLQHSKHTRFEINPYDEYAIEEAIRIKEELEDVHIDVISVGPSRAEDSLRRALGMGADEAVLIRDDSQSFRPPAVTAALIADYAKDKAYDLIFTGIMSEDEMNAQTGPMIAQLMGLPCATAVIKTDFSGDQKHLAIEREIEGGARDRFKTTMPCVLTMQTGINTPRYPALSKVMRARKKTIEGIPAREAILNANASRTETLRPPQNTAKGITLNGSTQEKADELFEILVSRSLV